MKSNALFCGLLLALATSFACADDIRSGRFIIPPVPVLPTPAPSAEMQRCLDELRARDAFVRVDQFRRIDDLPTWTRDQAKREVAFVYTNVSLPDSFRYAVIRGTGGLTVIVRAGGLQDVYDVFEVKAAEPGATANPDDAQRLREDH